MVRQLEVLAVVAVVSVVYFVGGEDARKVAAHLKKLAPSSVKIQVRNLHGGEAWVTQIDHPALLAGGRALKRAFGREAVLKVMYTYNNWAFEHGGHAITDEFLMILEKVLPGVGFQDFLDNYIKLNEALPE